MDAFLIRYGAPTLAGVKSASLFSLPVTSRQELGLALAAENRLLNPLGLYVALLRLREHGALILLYRKGELEQTLARQEEGAFLQALGYESLRLGDCLRELRRRLAEAGEFPHEIGLLLDYPLEDVRGFMADEKGKNSKCSGCWKVYGNEDDAQRRFCVYKQCTASYCSLFLRGRSLVQLAVPA